MASRLHSSHQSVVGHVRACSLPSKLLLPMGRFVPHPVHGSLSPQPKWHLDRFSRFCTAHVRVLSGMSGIPFPLKIVPSLGGSGPPSNTWILDPEDSASHMASWLVQPFLHSWWQKSLYSTVGGPFPQNCPLPWRIWSPSNTSFLGPIQAHNQHGNLDRLGCFYI